MEVLAGKPVRPDLNVGDVCGITVGEHVDRPEWLAGSELERSVVGIAEGEQLQFRGHSRWVSRGREPPWWPRSERVCPLLRGGLWAAVCGKLGRCAGSGGRRS